MADRMMTELQQLLLKPQSVFGAAEASLTNADFAEVENPEATFEPVIKDFRLAGANSGNIASVIGRYLSTVKFSFPLRSGASEGSFGLVNRILPAMGMAVALSDSGGGAGTNDRAVYTISEKVSEWKDMTGWGYSGHRDTSKSLLRKIQNVLFGGKFVFDFDAGSVVLECEGKGASLGAATVATQATCTPSAVLVPALKSITCTILGDADYVPVSGEIDFNQDVEVCIDPKQASGCGISIIKRNGSPKWSFKVYKDIPSVVDPEANLIARTPTSFSLVLGAAPSKFTFASSKMQCTSVKDSDQNGVQCWDLSGHFVDNDLTITQDMVS